MKNFRCLNCFKFCSSGHSRFKLIKQTEPVPPTELKLQFRFEPSIWTSFVRILFLDIINICFQHTKHKAANEMNAEKFIWPTLPIKGATYATCHLNFYYFVSKRKEKCDKFVVICIHKAMLYPNIRFCAMEIFKIVHRLVILVKLIRLMIKMRFYDDASK